MREEWKPVHGYEGVYEVSSMGRIKRVLAARGTNVDYIFSPSADFKGYLRTRLTNKIGVAKTVKIHRVVAQAFLENKMNLPQVNHKDGNKQNNCVDNLEWISNAANMAHAVANNLNGEGSWKGKFGANHNKSIPIKARNIDTGEEREIIGINQAARILKTTSVAIWRVLVGEYKHTKRWHFERL